MDAGNLARPCLGPSSMCSPLGRVACFGCRAEKGFRPVTPARGSQQHPAGVAATGVSDAGGAGDRSWIRGGQHGQALQATSTITTGW